MLKIHRLLPGAIMTAPVMMAAAILWGPILGQLAKGAALGELAKDYFFYDAASYMAVARNVADGAGVSIEPFTETGSSIYPSGHMWLVGKVGLLFGMTPFGAWTVTGFALGVLLLVLFGTWGRSVTGSRWGWLCASVPVLIGIAPWAGLRAWHVPSPGHSHALLWPAYAILYANGAETTALILAFLGLVLVHRSATGQSLRLWALAAAGGFLCGFALNVHTYVAMFALTVAVLVLALQKLPRLRRRWATIAAGTTAIGLAVSVVPVTVPVLRLAAILVALLLASIAGGLRSPRDWHVPIAFSLGAPLGAAPELLGVLGALRRGDDFLSLRQQTTLDLSLPPLWVLSYCLPTIALTIGALLFWRRDNGSRPVEHSLILAVALAGGLLVFNERWGFNQEPYRFLPYATLLLAVLCLPWLLSRVSSRADVAVRLCSLALLAATAPSTLAFVRSNHHVTQLSDYQINIFGAIAAHAPKGELVLLDACTPPAIFKMATGAPVAAFNPGMALPARREQLEGVIRAQSAGIAPTAAQLRAAGVGLVVVDERCLLGVAAPQYESSLGRPVQTVEASGAMIENSSPPGNFPVIRRLRVYRLYRVDPPPAVVEGHSDADGAQDSSVAAVNQPWAKQR